MIHCFRAYFIVFVLLGGCTLQPPPEPDVFKTNGQLKPTQRPYVIKGKDYYPQDHYEYDEVGIASWYGPGFHGKKTSTGVYFDTNKLTAAHNTLPLPCVVRVTNLENGRVIEVEVNDRGPFAHDRIIDLSRRAAQMLGFINKGLAQVRVECLPHESRVLNQLRREEASSRKKYKKQSKNLKTPHKKEKIHGMIDPTFHLDSENSRKVQHPFFVEVALCANPAEAKRKAQKISKFAPPRITLIRTKQKSVYRVTAGPFKTVKEAEIMIKRMKKEGEAKARLHKPSS